MYCRSCSPTTSHLLLPGLLCGGVALRDLGSCLWGHTWAERTSRALRVRSAHTALCSMRVRELMRRSTQACTLRKVRPSTCLPTPLSALHESTSGRKDYALTALQRWWVTQARRQRLCQRPSTSLTRRSFEDWAPWPIGD